MDLKFAIELIDRVERKTLAEKNPDIQEELVRLVSNKRLEPELKKDCPYHGSYVDTCAVLSCSSREIIALCQPNREIWKFQLSKSSGCRSKLFNNKGTLECE